LLAQESRNLAEAERLQRLQVDEQRRRAVSLLTRPAESFNAGEKNMLRSLAVSVSQLADILREQNKPECVEAYQEDYDISLRIDDKPGATVTAFNLGHAYKDLPALRNLDEAERWYRRSLELNAEGDRLVRGKCHNQLGNTVYQRFNDAKKEGKTKEELLKHLNNAEDYYQQALALLPPDAVDDLAVAHNQLGIIYKNAGDLESALEHYNHAIHFHENAGNFYAAGQTRRNVANALANNGRLPDALLYARAALRNFESYGGRAKDMEDDAKGLIEEIEKLIRD